MIFSGLLKELAMLLLASGYLLLHTVELDELGHVADDHMELFSSFQLFPTFDDGPASYEVDWPFLCGVACTVFAIMATLLVLKVLRARLGAICRCVVREWDRLRRAQVILAGLRRFCWLEVVVILGLASAFYMISQTADPDVLSHLPDEPMELFSPLELLPTGDDWPASYDAELPFLYEAIYSAFTLMAAFLMLRRLMDRMGDVRWRVGPEQDGLCRTQVVITTVTMECKLSRGFCPPSGIRGREDQPGDQWYLRVEGQYESRQQKHQLGARNCEPHRRAAFCKYVKASVVLRTEDGEQVLLSKQVTFCTPNSQDPNVSGRSSECAWKTFSWSHLQGDTKYVLVEEIYHV